MTISVQATFAETLVDELARGGVTDAVVAPGSRSTPVALALARQERIAVHVVLDERSAGFIAVGLALASGRPATVLTTSGTAAVELHPAIVEAHHAGVPLVALTADRPPDLHHVGAGQTIEQDGLFGRAVSWAATLDPLALPAEAWRSVVARAVAEAVGGRRGSGPVHLNLALREPLLGERGRVPQGRSGDRPWHGVNSAPPDSAPPGPPATPAMVADLLASGRRGVIVAGAGSAPFSSRSAPAVHRAAARLGWPVLADPRSGCRLPQPTTIAAADALLRDGELAQELRPEAILLLGQPWASRVLGEWLASAPDAETMLVDPYGRWNEPQRAASRILACDPISLCEAVAGAPGRTDQAWIDQWAQAENVAQVAIDTVVDGHAEPTEPGLARHLYAGLPDASTLVVSSSMPVRDVEWYARPRVGLRTLSNRGASGIDGVTSTAVGVALARPAAGPVVALLGDLAFLHDSGGLLAGRWCGADLTVVVVDNDGGGIFSFLPQAAALPEAEFEQLFGTPHHVDVTSVAAAYGAAVAVVDAAADVVPVVRQGLGEPGVRVVAIRTSRRANVAVHDEIHAAVAAAVRA